MQIPGLPSKPQSHEIPQAPRQVTSPEPPGQGIAPTRVDNLDSSSQARSGEMARLAAELSRTPEVRAEKVAQAAERLASGYYESRAAAEATAEQLLKAPDPLS